MSKFEEDRDDRCMKSHFDERASTQGADWGYKEGLNHPSVLRIYQLLSHILRMEDIDYPLQPRTLNQANIALKDYQDALQEVREVKDA